MVLFSLKHLQSYSSHTPFVETNLRYFPLFRSHFSFEALQECFAALPDVPVRGFREIPGTTDRRYRADVLRNPADFYAPGLRQIRSIFLNIILSAASR